MSVYLLDTSAILAHYLREPGWRQVADMLNGDHIFSVCAVSWLEFQVTLAAKGVASEIRARAIGLYGEIVAESIPVDTRVALAAFRVREATRPRLPAVDALIAGAAAVSGSILVHRDAHFDALPADVVKTLHLSETMDPPSSEEAVPVVKEAGAPYKIRRKRARSKA